MNFGKKNLDEIETLRETYKKREISSDEKIQIFRFGDKFYSTMHVLPRFETKILTHVISVYLQDKDTYLSPVFLVVEGNAGEGKTTQSIASCIQHGITTIYVSASQLSGSHEHDSIDVMENIYKKALELRKNGEKVALIIDDFHLSNANIDENIKKTINSSLLTGYLMNNSLLEKAKEIQKRINEELGFTVNIGLSTNKLLAKMRIFCYNIIRYCPKEYATDEKTHFTYCHFACSASELCCGSGAGSCGRKIDCQPGLYCDFEEYRRLFQVPGG